MRWYDSLVDRLLIFLLLPVLNKRYPTRSDEPEARGAALATLLICGPVGAIIFLFLQSRVFYRETRTEPGLLIFFLIYAYTVRAIVTHVLHLEQRVNTLLKKRKIRRLTEQFKQKHRSLDPLLVVLILLFFILVGMFSIVGLPLWYYDTW